MHLSDHLFRLLHSSLAQALSLAGLEQLLERPLLRRWPDDALPAARWKSAVCLIARALSGMTLSWASLAAFRLTPACLGVMPQGASKARLLFSRLAATAFNVPGCLPFVPGSILLRIPSVG